MKSLKEFLEATDPAAARAFGALRRMAVTLTAKALWQVAGFKLDDGTIETMQVEPFAGIGVSARPAASGKPEAIVIMIGDAKAPVIIAIRDEKTRAAFFKAFGALAEDESALHNSKSGVLVKADGTIEARSAGGTAVRLATKADIDALANYIDNTLVLTVATTGTATAQSGTATVATSVAPSAAGTTKLKGE